MLDFFAVLITRTYYEYTFFLKKKQKKLISFKSPLNVVLRRGEKNWSKVNTEIRKVSSCKNECLFTCLRNNSICPVILTRVGFSLQKVIAWNTPRLAMNSLLFFFFVCNETHSYSKKKSLWLSKKNRYHSTDQNMYGATES